MRNPVVIENIEGMRRREGIEDVELREAIRGLQVGDLVKVTLLTGAAPPVGETLQVRITSIRGSAFRGKLAHEPACTGLAKLRVGSPIAFTTAHIHSIPKGSRPMSNEVLTLGQQGIRGTDSNSLLRLYDLASEILSTSPLQDERAKADKAIQRITKELKKRNVPL